MGDKVLVVHSGGLDSTVLLYKMVSTVGVNNVVALNFCYGQKHTIEMECAKWHYEHLQMPRENVIYMDISNVFANDKHSTLLKGNGDIEHGKSYKEILDGMGGRGTVDTFVAYRNGVILSIAASVAYSTGCNKVAYGAHADDAAGGAYPDCTTEFIRGQGKAILEGTGGAVTLEAPFVKMNKSSVVYAGIEAGMTREEFAHTHSCYEGVYGGCHTCATCIDREIALDAHILTHGVGQSGQLERHSVRKS